MSRIPDPADRPRPVGDPTPMTLTRRAALGVAGLGGAAVGSGIAPLSPEEQIEASRADTGRPGFREGDREVVVRKLRDIVSVKDFGARGDGVSDDTAAIQAAFSSCARKVTFPSGRYLTGPLTVPDWLHIQGEAYQPGIGGDDRATELRFRLRGGAGLTCGLNPVIQNLFFQNTGGAYDQDAKKLSGTTAIAIALSENALIEDCCFSLWRECVRTGPATYYLKTSRLHFNRCAFGYRATAGTPYNIHLDAPHSVLTDVFIAGEPSCLPRNIKVFGGSVEGYEAIARQFSEISFFGTYFETDAPRADVIAIDPRTDRSSVALFGCLVYMNRTARFVGMSGLNGAMLTSVGNVYDGIGQSGGICLYLPASGDVTLSGDRFGDGHPADCLYVDAVASAAKFDVTFPALPAEHRQAAYGATRMIGPRGMVMSGLGEEPAAKPIGKTVMADGVGWDPLGRRAGRCYWVVWQGDRWGPLSG